MDALFSDGLVLMNLGLDPFTDSDDISHPVTLGDFIRFYEDAANCLTSTSRVAASGENC
jgi:hypothetical protein